MYCMSCRFDVSNADFAKNREVWQMFLASLASLASPQGILSCQGSWKNPLRHLGELRLAEFWRRIVVYCINGKKLPIISLSPIYGYRFMTHGEISFKCLGYTKSPGPDWKKWLSNWLISRQWLHVLISQEAHSLTSRIAAICQSGKFPGGLSENRVFRSIPWWIMIFPMKFAIFWM